MNKKRYKKVSLPSIDVKKQLFSSLSAQQQKRLDLLTALILIAFGAYHSILFFGSQIVPNADWMGFIQVGRKLVSFQLPTDYQRAPILGVLHVLLSKFLSGRTPELLAGWILNAVVHPLPLLCCG